MIQTRLKGMGVALITPFKEDESVDYDALMRLVDYQIFYAYLALQQKLRRWLKKKKRKSRKWLSSA